MWRWELGATYSAILLILLSYFLFDSIFLLFFFLLLRHFLLYLVQFSSVAQLCPTLCDPMDCNMPGLPVHHQPPEFTQTHVHRVSDAIQPSHRLSSSSPPAFNLSQHRSFQMSQLFSLGGQSIGVSASTSVLSVNTQDWSALGWTGWISLQSKGLWRVFSNTTLQKHQFFGAQVSLQSNSHIHTWLHTRRTLAGKVMSLLFNMLSRLVIIFLPRNKCLLISWLHSPSAVILEPPKIKSAAISTICSAICHEVMGPDLCFLNV